MTHDTDLDSSARLSVAPMMDWTDRHCRYFHRQFSSQALLYTEMVTAPAIVRGDARHLLAFDPAEQPVALQLGGADPQQLAQAARIGADEGYPEVNLNCGCPSDRVQSGAFGAIHMTTPDLVAEICSAMIAASHAEITVKCRIGVDDQDPHEVLPTFLTKIRAAGVRRVTIHARKAWLQGLSPKENRDIPPLDYPLVHQMKAEFPDLHISINGGIASLDEAKIHLNQGLDGVMIGRAAYHTPAAILTDADQMIWGQGTTRSSFEVVDRMKPYIADHIAGGGRMHHVTRHMLGLFSGQPGARGWRQVLSTQGQGDAPIEVLDLALARIQTAA